MSDTSRGQADEDDEQPAVPRDDPSRPASLAPADASALRRFLAGLDGERERTTFRVTVADGQTERTHDCWAVSVVEGRDDEPASLRCVPLAPGAPALDVSIDDVVELRVVDLPQDRFLASVETPVDRAMAYRRLATVAPETAPVAAPLGLLDRADASEAVQRDATRALREIAGVRPADCTPAIPVVRSWLEAESFAGRADALATLRAIGEDDPGAIATATEVIAAGLSSSDAAVRRAATGCVAALAEDAPEDVVDTVPDLARIASDPGGGATPALTGLARIAADTPGVVRPHATALRTVLLDDTRPTDARLAASAAVGRLVATDPRLGVDLVDDIVSILANDGGRLRSNVAGIVCDVATVHTDVVAPHVDALVSLLSVDEAYARVNASGVLGHVAGDVPDAVDAHRDAVVDLLDDDNHRVRENACWALGRLDAPETRAALETLARTDDHEGVRRRASWAVARIEPDVGTHAPTDT